MARLSQWEPYQNRVQAGMVDGEFLNASFTMIAAGPPRIANVGAAVFSGNVIANASADQIVFPIGIVQNFNLSHNRQFSRIWEIGSERSFFISGRTVGQLGMSRILYFGPSLLKTLYAYYQDLIPPTIVPSLFGATNLGFIAQPNTHNVKVTPGLENLYLNLASDLFNQPVGLMVYFRDSNENTYGAVYLESCFIPNHTMATDAQGTIIQENASVQFERALPIAVSATALIDISASDPLGLG
jgi:hypothetical protein